LAVEKYISGEVTKFPNVRKEFSGFNVAKLPILKKIKIIH